MSSNLLWRIVLSSVFFAHSVTHSTFTLSPSCQWGFGIEVVPVADSSLVDPIAISSAPSFPSMSMCPGTHDTSGSTLMFSSRRVVAISTNLCDICWLDPGLSFVIGATEDMLSANSTIPDRFLFFSGIACWNSIAGSIAPAFRHHILQRVSHSFASISLFHVGN